MARTKGSDGHSYERTFDLMMTLQKDGGIHLLTPAEPTDDWREKLGKQAGEKASNATQAARALIAAGQVPGRAGASMKAMDDKAHDIAHRFDKWRLTADGKLHQHVLMLHRWAKARFKVSAYEGQIYFLPPDAYVADPWQEYVPEGVPEQQRERVGRTLMAEALVAPYPIFLDRWYSFLAPDEPKG